MAAVRRGRRRLAIQAVLTSVALLAAHVLIFWTNAPTGVTTPGQRVLHCEQQVSSFLFLFRELAGNSISNVASGFLTRHRRYGRACVSFPHGSRHGAAYVARQ